ncbi:hypothetical protein AB0L25_39590 [Spirillospora sp. NPDC052242]
MLRGIFQRGEKPPKPYERLNETELNKTGKLELETLREELAGGVPDGPARAQAAECLELAEAIGRYGSGHEGRSGSGERLAVIVLARAGVRALRAGVPVDASTVFCWRNPLHEPASDHRDLVFRNATAPRALCAVCVERLDAGTAVPEPLAVPEYSPPGPVEYFVKGYFQHDRPTDLGMLMAEVRRRLAFFESYLGGRHRRH